ncbi:alanyl-tRNA editing protein [Caldiplasma sukawensis]
MTEKIYLKDAYLKETTANVLDITDSGIILDKTVFYAAGGGQPGDKGWIISEGKKMKIIDTVKSGDDVLHVADLNDLDHNIKGKDVKAIIDWERRHMLMRFHSAVHIIDAAVHLYNNETLITGSQIYDDRARVDFSVSNFSQDLANEIIENANRIISEKHNINVKFLPKDEALKIEGLARTEPGRKLLESLETVRIIEIEGVDMQSDGGTHVKNTSEVGTIVLQKIENKGSKNKRMYFNLL